MVRYMRGLVSTGFAVLIVSCSIVTAYAQAGSTGFILGTVTDPSEAVIPGATVSILNTTTNVKVSAQTDQYGNYFVQNLNIPGPYRVAVEAAGFRGFVRDRVVLDVDQRLRIDARLTVGVASDTVEVTGALTTLQTDSSSIGHAMDNTNIVSLPLLQ